MLSSLFSGVSGIKNEQAQMDVIANNIANVNTVGFKSSRITFTDALSQTLSGARGTAGNFGGANPIQIGRGAKISSIDTNFKQGPTDSTGIVTDLAINGKGFFVLSNGTGANTYSRAGAFHPTEDGYLMAQGGSKFVMGRIANEDGELESTTSLKEIKLPFGRKEPAKATSQIDLYCNLNRNASTEEEWIAGKALKVGNEPAQLHTDLSEINGNEVFGGDTIEISGTDRFGKEILDENGKPYTFTYGKDGTTVGEFLDKINSVFALGEENKDGAIAVLDSNGFLRLKAIEAGENEMSIYLSPADSNHHATTESHSTVTPFLSNTNPSSLSTRILDIDNLAGYGIGGTFTIEGTNPDGTIVAPINFEIEENSTMQDLLNSINANFTGVNATIDQNTGNIVVTDNSSGLSSTTIEIIDGTGTGMARNFTTETWNSTSIFQQGGIVANQTDTLNSLDNINYTAGDSIDLTITKTLGNPPLNYSISIDGTETIYNPGDPMDQNTLIGKMNTRLSTDGITASYDNATGKIIFTDSSSSDEYNFNSIIISESQLNDPASGGLAQIFEEQNVGTNKSSTIVPSFKSLKKGETGEHKTSIEVFDSMGEKHLIEIKYTQDLNKGNNRWRWEATIDNGSLPQEKIIGGNSGYVEFKDDGSLEKFSYDGLLDKLTFDPDGAQRLEIAFNAGDPGQFNGITQMASPSTNIAIDQNGYTLGVLNNINIGDNGIIHGIYSNGVNKTLAQIALATFTNEAGLQKEGNSQYSANDSTGNPTISWAGINTKTSFQSGYLESSNVDLTEEFAKLITSQKALEANSKVVNTADTILNVIVNQLKR